jgi:hypothetical protein
MKKFENWLMRKKTNKQIFIYAVICFLVYWTYAIAILGTLVSVFGYSIYSGIFPGEDFQKMFIVYGAIALFFSVAVEELFFRFPIAGFINKNISFTRKIFYIFLLSGIFGLTHFYIYSWSFWYLCVFVQGVGGVFFSFFYILSGENIGRTKQALIATTVLHFCIDAIVILPF